MRVTLLAALVLAGCKKSDESDEKPVQTTDPYAEQRAACEEQGFDFHPWQEGPKALKVDDLAPELEFETLGGTFVLSQAWTGCDVFVFVRADLPWGAEDTTPFLEDADRNSVFVFFSTAEDGATAKEDVKAVRDGVRDVLSDLPNADAAYWRDRVHYVSEGAESGKLEALVDSLGISDLAAIGHDQVFRPAGSLAVLTSDWLPMLSHARYTAKGLNYEARLARRFATEEAELGDDLLRIEVLQASWTDETRTEDDVDGLITVVLPDAAELARFDRAEMVMRESCGDSPYFHGGETCTGERGHIVNICEPDCVTGDQDGIFKVISGYNTGGWWTMDATSALPALKKGGSVEMRIAAKDDDMPLSMQIEFRLYDEVDETQSPSHAVHMEGWTGFGLQAVYDEWAEVVEVTPPPGTTKVALWNLATTHGGGGSGGCAEFCTTEQVLYVNDQPFEHAWEQKDVWDCAARVDQGVTPNQWGTWYFDRASWCPGWTGELWEADLTSAFDLNGTNRLEITATQGGEYPYTGDLPSNPWLVFYGASGADPVVQPLERETCSNVQVTARDFAWDHPDFEPLIEAYEAMDPDDPERVAVANVVEGGVAQTLSVDGVPQLIWPENTLPFTTAASFDEWFKDAPGTNVSADLSDRVTRTRAGTAIVVGHGGSDDQLQPLLDDSFGFGPGVRHERLGSYTLEVSGSFSHEPGQQLRFGSGDDLWVFVDGQLVIDSGGWNGHMTSYNGYQRAYVLELDDLGLTPGQPVEIKAFLVDRGHDGTHKLWAEMPDCQP